MAVKTFLDIDRTTINTKGVAYYRLPDHFYKFLKKCQEEGDIAGFEWDLESRNFGVILADKKN